MFSRKEYEIASQVVKIIRIIIKNEIESEQLKITLAENIRFDVFDAFSAIDRHSKGYFTAQDLFNFMVKNGYSVQLKICQFFVYILSNGNEQMNYREFMEFIVPRYDKEASMQCIARKLYSEIKKNHLTFYLEEFVTKLIWQELEYFKSIEVEKMKLAQLSEWKFMRVFSLISNGDPIDKKLLDGFLMKTGNDRLSQDEFLYFMTRFNRNKDKLIQKDEFSDSIFPNGYLLQRSQQDQTNTFDNYIKNYENQLDQFLDRNININQNDNVEFRPEEHKFNHDDNQKQSNGFVVDQTNRQFMAMDPYLAVSTIVPDQVVKREYPTKLQSPSQFPQSIPITQTFQPNSYVAYKEIDPNSTLRYYNVPAYQPYKNRSILGSQIHEESYSQLYYQSGQNQNKNQIRNQQSYINEQVYEQKQNRDLLNAYIQKGGQNNFLVPKQKPNMGIPQNQQPLQTYGKQLEMSQSITKSQVEAYQQQPSNKDMLMQQFK